MNLGDFIDTFKEAIARRVVESYPPLYRPSENGGTLPRLPQGVHQTSISSCISSSVPQPFNVPFSLTTYPWSPLRAPQLPGSYAVLAWSFLFPVIG